MEVLKIIKRIAYYLLFVTAATICYSSLLSLALAPYTDAWGALSYDLLANDVYLRLLYAFLALGVTVVAQVCLIKKPSDVESVVYPWLLVIYFGIGTLVSAYALTRGLLAINQEIYNKNPVFLLVPVIVSMLFTLSEVLYGIVLRFRIKRDAKVSSRPSDQDEKTGETDAPPSSGN